MNLGKTIKKIRTVRGINQEALSNFCGITQAYLSLIENNKKEPTLNTLEKIALGLEIPLSVLIYLSTSESDINIKKNDFYKAIDESFRKLIAKEFDLTHEKN